MHKITPAFSDDYILVNFENYDIIKHKKKIKGKESLNFTGNARPSGEPYLKIGSIETANFLEHNKLVIPIHFNTFFNDIFKSYKNNEHILQQFIKDSKRIRYIVNGHCITDPDVFLDYFRYKFNNKLIYTILLLCTQPVLAMPLELIQKNIIDKDYFIFEPDNNKLCQLTINIKILNNSIQFKIFKRFRIVKFIDDNPVNKFHIHLKQEFDIYQNYNKFIFPQYLLLHILTRKTIKD